MTDKIVVTGISAVTPLGNTLDTISDNLKNGVSGIQLVKRYSLERLPVRHGGIIDETILRDIDYPFQTNLQFKLFYYCLKQLYRDFQDSYPPNKIGCIIGTDPNTSTLEDLETLFKAFKQSKKDRVSTFQEEANSQYLIQKIINVNPSTLFYHASKDFQINGSCFCNLGTCSASTQAIGDAYKLLKSRDADLIITGGVSSKLDPVSMARLCRLKALEPTQDDINQNCCPFDKRRNGFTIGEGAVLFILEREEDAKRRNARIYAEIKGYGAALDGFSITDPHEDALGMSLAMQRAIGDAKLNIKEIDYLNAHGTGTAKNDKFETEAIKKVFKDYAHQLDISSTKSMHGHLMTAAGAMEVLTCIVSVMNDFVPPTINYKVPDSECDLFYNPNQSKDKKINHALTNSFGLGGQNASLVVSKYQ